MYTLKQILNFIDVQCVQGSVSDELKFNDIETDSRLVSIDSLFIAISGTQADGHDYLDAIGNQVVCVVVEDDSMVPDHFTGVVLKADCSRLVYAQLAKLFYSPEIDKMSFFGVTGTNGKTSICYILESLLTYFDEKIGVLGTNNHRLGEQVWSSELTTPGPKKLHLRLSEMQDCGASKIAMEVSSHALAQKRVAALEYDVAIFSNLTRDHLNYHKTFEAYFAAKEGLFVNHLRGGATSVVNGDDVYGKKIKPTKGKLFTYGQRLENDFVFRVVNTSFAGISIELKYQDKAYQFISPLIGEHNAYNLVAAMVALWARGYLLEDLLQACKSLKMIPGRLESILNPHGINVFVDYAHTHDALEKVLLVVNNIRKNLNLNSKIIVVFGCGGDRDKSKRPLMFSVAKNHSDICVVTSDNPRTEKPMDIIYDIVGDDASVDASTYIEVDRKTAIFKAIELAEENDILLIAGKGHEDYQIIGTEKKHFSDHEIVREALSAL